MASKYGKKAQKKVKRAMHERKRGTLKSGRSGRTVKSRKQAIAIGLSEARKAGAKVPSAKKGGARRKTSARKTSSGGRKTSARKTAGRKKAGGTRSRGTAARKKGTGR